MNQLKKPEKDVFVRTKQILSNAFNGMKKDSRFRKKAFQNQ
ncbi:MAG: hypothetical protein ACKVOK_08335 [Flavobacteriales bacterium]